MTDCPPPPIHHHTAHHRPAVHRPHVQYVQYVRHVAHVECPPGAIVVAMPDLRQALDKQPPVEVVGPALDRLPDAGSMSAGAAYAGGSDVSGGASSGGVGDLSTPPSAPVTPSGVPEPGAWTLALIGFGLIGGRMRARRVMR